MPRPLSLAAVAALVAVGIVAASASGGTEARFSSNVALPAATITAGTATLVVTPLTLTRALLYPGLTLTGTVTVSNTGDTPLALSAAVVAPAPATALSLALVVGAGPMLSSGTCTSDSSVVWKTTLATPTAGPLNTTLGTGASISLCVQVSLDASSTSNASQSQAAQTFGLVITGVQTSP